MSATGVSVPFRLLSREYNVLKLDDLGGGGHRQNIELFRRSVDVVENELLDPNDLGEAPFTASYGRYLDMLDRYQALTYGQMIVCAAQALAAGDTAADAVLEPLRHVIVDEYQDTNPAQEELVQLLASRGANVTVVGDDDQSIYQWRGATVQNILTFAKRYASVRTIGLPHNRRSQPAVIDVAEAFVHQQVSERLPKSMKAHRDDEGGLVTCWAADTAEDEAGLLAATVVRLHKQGFAWRDMAVLLRSVKTSAAPVVAALESRGVPVRSSGASGLFVEADAHLYARTYAWLADKQWNEDRWSSSFVTVDPDDLLSDYAAAFQLTTKAKERLRRRLEEWRDEAAGRAGKADESTGNGVQTSQCGAHGGRPRPALNRAFCSAAWPSNTALPVTMGSQPKAATRVMLTRGTPPSTAHDLMFEHLGELSVKRQRGKTIDSPLRKLSMGLLADPLLSRNEVSGMMCTCKALVKPRQPVSRSAC